MSRSSFSKIAEQIEKDGYERGYRQGIKDARRSMGGALDDLLKTPADSELEASLPLLPDDPVQIEKRVAGEALGNKKSAEARVLDAIVLVPGQRGAEVVSLLEATGEPIKERTVRTALFRLKKSGSIGQIDGRWFPSQKLEGMLT
jgi:hypothetical protein